MNIDELKAGRELDALVAEKVMGWEVCNSERGAPPRKTWDKNTIAMSCPIPHYSTDIAAAWEVLCKFKRNNPWECGDILLVWGNYGEDGAPKAPHGQICYPQKLAWLCRIENEKGEYVGIAESAPLAICLAALKAVGVSF